MDDIDEIFNEVTIEKIFMSLTNNKSPGSDGLPAEFYKKCWHKIKKYLLASYKSVYINKLNITQRQGVISLIMKKDKDKCRLKNWQPITLLNTDYKILTKTIVEYIKLHLDNIIHRSRAEGRKSASRPTANWPTL